MPYETLRFIHAAKVLVDHSLSDTGPLPPTLRELVRDSSVQAFRRLVTACVEQDIDFLLLTGDALEQTDHSIRSRVELRQGFEELDDMGIQVFVVPGRTDPIDVWDKFPELPSNVTVFRPDADDPVAVLRDGSVIASIRSLNWRQSWFAWDDHEPVSDRTQRRSREADEEESYDGGVSPTESLVSESADPELEDETSDFESQSLADDRHAARSEGHREIRRIHSPADLRPNHFAIAIARDGVDRPGENPQADYLAVVGGNERRTTKGTDWLMHFPGGTQGMSPDETGLHGCSLVDLDVDGVIRCRFLPTSPVRWESNDIDLDDGSTFDELADELQTACRRFCGTESKVVEFGDADDRRHSDQAEELHAQACLFRWVIRGHGALFDSLQNDTTQSALIARLESDLDWPADVPHSHRFRLIATEPAIEKADNDDEQLDVPSEYFWRVDQAQPLGTAAWSDLGTEQLTRLNAAAPRCDAEVVFSQARRRGWNWFSKAGNASRVRSVDGGRHASTTEAKEGAAP